MELLTPRQDHVSDVKPIDDPGVDTEFFNLLLPLPYRVAILLTLGVWLWAANLRGLMSKNMRVDVPALIRYPSRMQQNQLKHWQSTNRFAIMLTVPLSVSLLLFWILSRFDESLVLRWELLGDITLLAIVCALLLPSLQVPWMRTVAPSGRARFAKALRRIALGGIATTDEGRFGDVILADALTSYSKVVGDLFVVACMLLRWPHPTAKPDRDCGGAITVPLLMAVPFLIRFSQCLIEFRRVRSGQYGEGHGWGGTHLLNAAKYFTAFPVFFFSTRMAPHEYREGGWGYDFWYAGCSDLVSNLDIIQLTKVLFLGGSPQSSTRSIPSIGMSPRTGTSSSSPPSAAAPITPGVCARTGSSSLLASTTSLLSLTWSCV